MLTIILDAPTVLIVGIITGAAMTHIGISLGRYIERERMRIERQTAEMQQFDEDIERYRHIRYLLRNRPQTKEARHDDFIF